MTDAELDALAKRVDGGSGPDNSLDVLIDVALFEADEAFVSCRSNSAGTKVIFTDHDGKQHTHWAQEWTGNRAYASGVLRGIAQSLRAQEGSAGGEGV